MDDPRPEPRPAMRAMGAQGTLRQEGPAPEPKPASTEEVGAVAGVVSHLIFPGISEGLELIIKGIEFSDDDAPVPGGGVASHDGDNFDPRAIDPRHALLPGPMGR